MQEDKLGIRFITEEVMSKTDDMQRLNLVIDWLEDCRCMAEFMWLMLQEYDRDKCPQSAWDVLIEHHWFAHDARYLKELSNKDVIWKILKGSMAPRKRSIFDDIDMWSGIAPTTKNPKF